MAGNSRLPRMNHLPIPWPPDCVLFTEGPLNPVTWATQRCANELTLLHSPGGWMRTTGSSLGGGNGSECSKLEISIQQNARGKMGAPCTRLLENVHR